MSENTQQKNGVDLSLFSPEEREIITAVTKNFGRELTAKEINWSLAQARAIGALPKNRRGLRT